MFADDDFPLHRCTCPSKLLLSRVARHARTSRKFNCILTFGSKKHVSIEIEIRFSREIVCERLFYLV